jgi:hypothetical protein
MPPFGKQLTNPFTQAPTARKSLGLPRGFGESVEGVAAVWNLRRCVRAVKLASRSLADSSGRY